MEVSWINADSSKNRLGLLYSDGKVLIEGFNGGFVYGDAETAFLVAKAVNTHDKLVTALRGMIRMNDDSQEMNFSDFCKILDDARALLKTLKEQDKGEEDSG